MAAAGTSNIGEPGAGPHPSMDHEATGSKSGYHGWWDGWQRPLAVVVGRVWLPWAAECTIASATDNLIAPSC